jgi:putative PIN family toxin of toxin-antitoxin system
MRVVLDTNVFISGVFFSDPPYTILQAWRDSRIRLIISPEILGEYRRVAHELSTGFPGIDIADILDLLLVKAEMVDAAELSETVSADADDDKFLAWAIAGSSRHIVSGDKHLLDVSAYRDVIILKPRQFVDRYLAAPESSE